MRKSRREGGRREKEKEGYVNWPHIPRIRLAPGKIRDVSSLKVQYSKPREEMFEKIA